MMYTTQEKTHIYGIKTESSLIQLTSLSSDEKCPLTWLFLISDPLIELINQTHPPTWHPRTQGQESKWRG